MALERQLADLEKLAERARHVLEDPRKQKWHEDNRMQLQQIEAEIARLRARALPLPSGEGRGEGARKAPP